MEFLADEKYKICRSCKRVMPDRYEGELCPFCADMELFDQVRTYIRENDVNEHDVAEKFDIPLGKVKQWIKDGRIEYKENVTKRITEIHCTKCGCVIFGGKLCPKCAKALMTPTGYYTGTAQEKEDDKLRFLAEARKQNK